MNWSTIIEIYQDYLKMFRRRYIIQNIYPFIRKEYNINRYDDSLLDELEFLEMLPNTDHLIFRGTKIIVADHMGHPFETLQHINAMIELVPHLKKIPTLSDALMNGGEIYISMLDLGIRFPNLNKEFQINHFRNPYELCIFSMGKEVSVSHHNLDGLIEKITTYIADL